MKVLIDSSVIIDYLRSDAIGKETPLSRIRRKVDGFVFSLISVGEVFSGKSAEERAEDIKSVFKIGTMVGLDFTMMETAGRIRRETGISLLDAIIAASALALDLPLATLNQKDFKKVKGLKLYQIK